MGNWKVGDVNRLTTLVSIAVVTPTDCPKSVRNRCAMEVSEGVVVLSVGFLIFLVDVGVL